VNESFVRTFFSKQNPLGQRFGGDNPASPDPKHCKNLDGKSSAWFVTPSTMTCAGISTRRSTLRRVKAERSNFAPPATQGRRYALSADSAALRIRSSDLRHQNRIAAIDELLFNERLIARLSSFFGLLALLLACVGLYGLLSYEVARHTRETGIRMALGAQPRNVLRGVVRHGVVLTSIGAAVGIAGSLAVTRLLGSLLFGVRPSDPVTLIGVSCLLLMVALAACYIPARRATRVDPLVALRHEQ